LAALALAWAEPRRPDLFFSLGLASMAVGFGMAYLPLAFIVPGGIVCGLVTFVWVRSLPPRPRPAPPPTRLERVDNE
jgi:hypothetical protein